MQSAGGSRRDGKLRWEVACLSKAVGFRNNEVSRSCTRLGLLPLDGRKSVDIVGEPTKAGSPTGI